MRATENLNPEETLVIVISKTFTTTETIFNARIVRSWLVQHMPHIDHNVVVRQHMAACSSELEISKEFGLAPENVFEFWDWVGGRFSVHSAAGVLPLALHYGFPIVRNFLDGAHAMDRHFASAPFGENLPVMLGLFSLWSSSFLGYPAKACLPYSQALLRFPAYLQQLEMESNGKGVDMEGVKLPFDAGEIVFGEPGTNGQHSFYQLLHQGRVIPAEFIGVCRSQSPVILAWKDMTNHDKFMTKVNHDELMTNFFAQPDALAVGISGEQCRSEGIDEVLIPHLLCSGNRPSMSILLPCLDAFNLGQLVALYEHKVVVQGFVWGINSFDQWGVQLGKTVAKGIREKLKESRKRNVPPPDLNPSTTSLLKYFIENS